MQSQANILDPIRDSLPPSVWNHPADSEPELKPVHAHFITRHIYHVLEKGGYPKPHEWAKLFITGSLCTYQYSDASDCDVSLFVQSDHLPEWSRAEMIGLMIQGTDGVVLPGTPYELQAYVVSRGIDPTDLFKPGLRAGYSVDDHRWVNPPDKHLAHNVEAQEHGTYVWALQQADKMERLLKYEPDHAVRFWHQIHRKRHEDEVLGRGDFSDSNILYKFLAHRKLMPQIAEVSGEHIAAESLLPIQMSRGCPRCHYPEIGEEGDPCPSCGYVIPYDGWELMQGHNENGPVPGSSATGWGGPALDEEEFPRALLGEPKFGGWQDHFVNQIQPIAQAYSQLPEFDPNAVGAWHELAADSERRANDLRNRFNITETDNPEPYANAQEMFHDINKGNFAVSRANSEHPIWTPDQNVNFRIVHDVLGHHPSGGDFSWQGENQACGSHFPLLSDNAQRALMTECLGQTGYAMANGGFGPQKVGLMDHLLQPAQQAFSMAMPDGGFCHRHIRHGIYQL